MTSADTRTRPDILGVLGGMGPLATADFLTKLISLTPAREDADHIPLVVSSEPHIPARVLGMANDAPGSPLAAMLERRDFLIKGGAQAIAMPCNTAHYWYADLKAGLDVPFLHIVEAVIGVLEAEDHAGATIGLMGTRATIEGRLYEDPIRQRGFACLVADKELTASHVVPGIALVKQNRIPEARALLRHAVERLADAGAEKVVLGCTELPVGLDMSDAWVAERCIDPTAALAQACVDWAMAARQQAGIG
ncbi:MAG: aspartate/glutamate racemase family protein [Rhodospirillales bacterium]|nr:aspartate/glutamate racemase family protein [Rhodospirillales bacterium]